MARDMQKKVLANLQAHIVRHGLEGVEKFSCSNLGVIYVQREDDFKTLFRIDLAFQSGYMTVGIIREGEDICMGLVHGPNNAITDPERRRSFPHLEYHDGSRMEKFMAAVVAELEKHGRAVSK